MIAESTVGENPSLQKKPTEHAKMRAEERLGISDVENYALGALHCGLTDYDVAQYPHLKEYLDKRDNNKYHKAVFYKGACFIFVSSSSRLITCYKITGDEVLKE